MTARSSNHSPTSNGTSKPSPGAAAHGATQGRVASTDGLQQELAQKDQLIQALMEQLEQAAEQLDRLHRTGADRVRGASSGGLPAAMVDDQKRTLEDLQRVVQQWEDMQAGLTLGRIEIQIAELRELVVQAQHFSPAPHGNGSPQPVAVEIHHEAADFQSSATADSHDAPGDSAWEKMKLQLLAGEEASTTVSEWETVDQPLPDYPTTIDPDVADLKILRSAISERDAYIALLLSRLRGLEVFQPADKIAALDLESPQLQERIHQLEQRLLEHLRCAEVELSVERAKIGRERAQLAQQQELIERQLRKLGLSSVEDIDPSHVPSANSQERRWARFLGRPKGE